MPRGKPAGGDEQISSSVGDLGLEEPQELPHRCISNSSGQLAVGHHSQDVEIFEANDPTGPCQFGGELVLHIPPDVGNLLMLACHLEPLFLIILTKHGSFGFGIFRFLFL